MGLYIRTNKVEEDLIEIWMYIAVDNPTAADKFLDQIDAKCVLLANNLGIGLRSDIAPELRYFPVTSYLILYREINQGIEVVRVVHGARHLPDIIV